MALHPLTLEGGDLLDRLHEIVQLHLIVCHPGPGMGTGINRAEGTAQITAATGPDLQEIAPPVHHTKVQTAYQGYLRLFSDMKKGHLQGLRI